MQIAYMDKLYLSLQIADENISSYVYLYIYDRELFVYKDCQLHNEISFVDAFFDF